MVEYIHSQSKRRELLYCYLRTDNVFTVAQLPIINLTLMSQHYS